MVIDAVVTKFSDGLHCNIGNKFFTEFPFLRDIFQANHCKDTRPRSAPASPPREFTDAPENADTLIDCDGRGHSSTTADVISPPGGDSDRLTGALHDNTAVTPLHEVDAYHNTDDDRHSALLNNGAASQTRETCVSARTTRVDTDIIHDNACNTYPT